MTAGNCRGPGPLPGPPTSSRATRSDAPILCAPTRHSLTDDRWLRLVSQLLELAPDDFESVVLGVRLQRRLEAVAPESSEAADIEIVQPA
jgi:hypothetical protein